MNRGRTPVPPIVAQLRDSWPYRFARCRKLVTGGIRGYFTTKRDVGYTVVIECVRRLPMENVRDPRQHINEEPRDDFMDTAIGFGAMFGFMFVVFAVAVIVKFIIS
jgi:hypothetical protein